VFGTSEKAAKAGKQLLKKIIPEANTQNIFFMFIKLLLRAFCITDYNSFCFSPPV